MIPHKQLHIHDPENGVYGDCQRTVYACLLDLPNPGWVPHQHKNCEGAEFWQPLNEFLANRGLRRVKMLFTGDIPLTDVLGTMGHINPGVYYTLSGKSGKFDCNHVVICCGNEIVHDPSPVDSGVVGPCIDDGFYWLEWLVPTSMTATGFNEAT